MDVAPAPAPWRDPALEPTWHPRGLKRAKYEGKIGKFSQRSSDILKAILKELYETDRETVEKEVLQEGGSHTVPPSDDETGAIQSTGVPVLSNAGEAHRAGMYEFFQEDPGVGGKRNSNAADANDFQKYCIEGVVAVLGSMLFGMAACGAICLWRKRKRRLSAASGARPGSRPAHPSTPESQTRRQQPPSVPGKVAHLPPSPRGPAPARPDSRPARPARPPPPRPSWVSNSASLLRNGPARSSPPRN